MSNSVILGGARTPVGKMNGALASKSAVELGGIAISEAIRRSQIEPEAVEHVIMGQVLQGGAGRDSIAASCIQRRLGADRYVETINRVCGSGLRAVSLADTLIRAEGYEVIVAGGMESMSGAYLVRQGRGGYRMGHAQLEDMMITDGLYALEHVQMGTHGDSVAAEEHISREEQDAWALALIKPHSRHRMLAGFRLRSSRSRSPGARKRLLSKRMKRLVVTPASKRWPSSSRSSTRTAP